MTNYVELLNYHRLVHIERLIKQIYTLLHKPDTTEADFRAALLPTVKFLEELAKKTKTP